MYLTKVPLFENPDSGFVYHYTSHTTALEHIFHKGEILFGKLGNTNDPYERYVWDFDFDRGGNWLNDHEMEKMISAEKIVEAVHSRCHLFCTALDSSRGIEKFLGRGFSIPSLWAHYAANHKGVCLAFDKSKLCDAIQTAAAKIRADVFIKDIKYGNPPEEDHPAFWGCDLKTIFDSSIEENILDHVKSHHETLLFTKDSTWGYENETRYAVISKDNEPFKINISEAIVGVILGMNFSSSYYPLIEKAKKEYQIESARIEWIKGRPYLFPCP